MPYLLVHCAVNIACIVLAPEIGVLMLMVLFVIFAFVSLRMDLGRMLPATVIVALVVAAIMAWLGNRLTLPMETWQERAISALWFALILIRTSLLGLNGSQLRKLLAKRNTQLAASSCRHLQHNVCIQLHMDLATRAHTTRENPCRPVPPKHSPRYRHP